MPFGFCKVTNLKLGKTSAFMHRAKIANGLTKGVCEKRAVQNLGGFATETRFVQGVQNPDGGGGAVVF